jgi:hypothetical protein
VACGPPALVSLAMLQELRTDGVHELLERTGWVADLAALAGVTPAGVVDRLVADLTASGALAVHDGLLVPTMAFEPRG